METRTQEFHIEPARQGWTIRTGDSHLGDPRPTRALAVTTAETIARGRSGGRVIVYATDGSVVADYRCLPGSTEVSA